MGDLDFAVLPKDHKKLIAKIAGDVRCVKMSKVHGYCQSFAWKYGPKSVQVDFVMAKNPAHFEWIKFHWGFQKLAHIWVEKYVHTKGLAFTVKGLKKRSVKNGKIVRDDVITLNPVKACKMFGLPFDIRDERIIDIIKEKVTKNQLKTIEKEVAECIK